MYIILYTSLVLPIILEHLGKQINNKLIEYETECKYWNDKYYMVAGTEMLPLATQC